MAKHVLLCPPAYFDVVDQKNPYMSQKVPVDREKAHRQWQALCSALEQTGCRVETIPPAPGLEDMVFAANQVFVGFHDGVGKFIVPSRMAHASRQREVTFYVDWYRQRGFKIIEVDLGADHLEGHGDLLWHPDWSRIYAGYGFRSTEGGVEKFRGAMTKLGIPVVALHLVDRYCYHLDTCFCPLNLEAVLVYPGAYAPESLATLREQPRPGKNSETESLYVDLASLVRYEHVQAAMDAPQFAAAMAKLEADDAKRQQANFTLADLHKAMRSHDPRRTRVRDQ